MYIQRQIEEGKLREARYNRKYKELNEIGDKPKYLEGRNGMDRKDGMAIRTIIRLRCGNMEEENSIGSKRRRRFCGGGRDNLEHFIEECNNTKEWFNELGSNRRERVKRIWEDNLNKEKAGIFKKLWKKKERSKKKERKKI